MPKTNRNNKPAPRANSKKPKVDGLASDPYEGAERLPRPEQETFVRDFLRSFDPAAASETAGIEPMQGLALLEDAAVRARLQFLAHGPLGADLTPEGLAKRLLELSSVSTSELIVVDPVTGEASYDLRGATPAQLEAFEIEEVVETIDGRTKRKVTKKLRNPMPMISAALKLLSFGADTEDGAEQPSKVGEWMAAINAKGSAAPVVRPVSVTGAPLNRNDEDD